ncbi:7701_t:CDS:2, partial [Rhizophagus irregularis]
MLTTIQILPDPSDEYFDEPYIYELFPAITEGARNGLENERFQI